MLCYDTTFSVYTCLPGKLSWALRHFWVCMSVYFYLVLLAYFKFSSHLYNFWFSGDKIRVYGKSEFYFKKYWKYRKYQNENKTFSMFAVCRCPTLMLQHRKFTVWINLFEKLLNWGNFCRRLIFYVIIFILMIWSVHY